MPAKRFRRTPFYFRTPAGCFFNASTVLSFSSTAFSFCFTGFA
jgi:hypothetical protein